MADPRPDVMEIERRRIKRMEMKDQIKYELTSSYSESVDSCYRYCRTVQAAGLHSLCPSAC